MNWSYTIAIFVLIVVICFAALIFLPARSYVLDINETLPDLRDVPTFLQEYKVPALELARRLKKESADHLCINLLDSGTDIPAQRIKCIPDLISAQIYAVSAERSAPLLHVAKSGRRVLVAVLPIELPAAKKCSVINAEEMQFLRRDEWLVFAPQRHISIENTHMLRPLTALVLYVSCPEN